MEFTVFTPTYNRAHTISELYDSLKNQTFKDFEWIVIDDGSTDGTKELFEDILSDTNGFNIRYYQTENRGKHCAINKAVGLAKGRLFFIVDSDDHLPCESLEILYQYEESICNSEKRYFCGIAGLRGKNDKEIIGSSFSGDYLDCTYLEAPSYSICGDKSEVYYTELLKKYPFPEFENERFIPESVAWNAIAADGYKLRYFNKITYLCKYLDDGLTSQGERKYKEIPKGYGLFISQSIKYGKIKKLRKWNEVFNYYKMFHEGMSNAQMAGNLNMNPVYFYLRILGIRLFYKLYNN